MARRMNKFFSILLVLCMIISMMPAAVFAASTPSVLYLKPNSEWLTDGARFAAYFFGSSGNIWVSMTDSNGDGYYEATVPSGYSSVIFCRMNPGSSTNSWDTKWNQTGDLTVPTNGNNCYTMNSGSWDTGTWGTYSTTVDYYLIGYINGANYGCEEDSSNMGSYKFEDGKLTATFASDSYVFVKTSNNANWYMTEGYQTGTSATLYNTSSGLTDPNKLLVPGNVEITFTLTVNSDGTLTLSYVTNTCEHSYSSVVTTAPTCSTAGVKTYTCANCDSSYTESIAATGHSYTNGVCSVCGYSKDNNINIHFVNTLGWQGVVGYSWVISGSATGALNGVEWPGQIAQRDADGYYTMALEYKPVSGESLGIVFHDFNGNQTADVTLSYSTLSSSHEIWVKPSTTANSDGKFDCTTAISESGMVISPEINGTAVTFRYQNSSASAVYLAGTMNDWSTSANKMTKGSDGVWSITMTLEPGVYEYKFVADGEWYLDPTNGIAGGYDGNSVLVVPTDDETTNTGKITVVLHFYRSSGDYTDWDVWFWGSEKSGSADFQTLDGDKGMIATFTVDGSANSNVGYIVRKGDWEDKEFYDRFIDLSDVVSGNVHYYVNSGVATGSRILGEDVVFAAKPSYANYNYDTGAVWLKTSLPLSSALAGDFKIVDASGNSVDVTITDAALDGNGYTLTLSRSLSMSELNSYQVKYGDYYATISINTHDLFYSSKFATEYTYYGDDLGATWSESSTTFKVWAPTAQGVAVKIYASGNYANADELKYVNMTQGEKGVWSVTVSGDWSGKYYNYVVTFPTYTVEATDPYAVSTGANGDRGMILNMDTTDPEGWENDISPNAGMNYTDAIIYELHVREFTIDSSSGVKNEWKGKYLGLTQSGTNYNGYSTGLEHLKELGVTHVQLMPVYDYNSVDEYHLTDWQQYAWGYDPKNYNVPEGSYSTDPFDGSVRVTEFKEMVQTFHENGINVVMDVVYNHTFDGGNFCYNKIVPNYFSRFYGEGNWSNGSGCGNDLATERSMARNYIVDSILHWVEEYHIDGFRFDLAGLIDTQTINEIVNTVHAKYPYVIFYGEGWAPGGTAVEYGYSLTTQGNAWEVGGFGFFSDTFREVCVPNSTSTWGFATGSGDVADAVARYMRASTDWSTTPSQIVNYTSCHDNYCLTDKIILTRGGESWYNMTSMNRLSAAMIMLSQGVPFIYSGDELLREKKDSSGTRYHNGYGASDEVTKIYWSDLANKDYSQLTDDYYAGLIEFRKNHAALRSPDGADIWNNTTYTKISNNCIMLYIKGGFNYECSSGIVILLNSGSSTAWVDLYDKIPSGYWQACIHGSQAGVDALWGVDVTSSSGNVGVDPYSATVLVLGDLAHEQSVYNSQAYLCSHDSHNTSGLCTSCGATVEHSYASGKCSVCGLSEDAPETFTVYYDNSSTNWSSVNIYAWTNAASRTVEYTDSWPGSAMTLVGDNIYSYELPIGATNVIFNDGGDNQTDDLTAPAYNSGLNLYSSATSSWTTYAEPVTVPTIEPNSATLSLEGEVYYNIYFTMDDASSVKELGLITFNTEPTEGTIDNADCVLPGAEYNSTTNQYTAHTMGVPAKKLGDDLYIRIYAEMEDGSYIYSRMFSYSAKTYAYKKLSSTATDPDLKNLVIAMLNYGAEAQLALNYKTDALVNADLTAEQKASIATYTSDMMASRTLADSVKAGNFANSGQFDYRSASMILDGALAINYRFIPTNTPDDGITLYYWDEATYNSVNVMTKDNATGHIDMVLDEGYYTAAYEGLAAKELDETIYVVAIYTSGGEEYTTEVIAYSLATYCNSASSKGTVYKALGEATVVYSYYAKIFFQN